MVTWSPSTAGRPTSTSSASVSRSRSTWASISSSVTARRRHGHLQPGVARGWRRSGRTSTTASKASGPALLARGDVDLGRGDRVDLGVGHGLGVEVGQRLAEGLGPQGHGPAHAGLEHLAGHLARTEARDPHLAGEGRARSRRATWSTSGSSTSTERRTLLPSTGSAVARIRSHHSTGPHAPARTARRKPAPDRVDLARRPSDAAPAGRRVGRRHGAGGRS